MNDIIIGIDGGGTKTRLAAVDTDTGKIVSTAEVGGINACTLGAETAVQNFIEGIRALDISVGNVIAAAIGNPTIDDETEGEGEEFERLIKVSGILPQNVKYFSLSDVGMALYAFTRGKAGALIVAGTGSMGVAFGKPYRFGKENVIYTVGGWGEPTRDGGSGYYIAVKGIEAAMDAFDAVAPETELCRYATEFFGVGSPRGLIGAFNGSGIKKPETAAFSRKVAECADKGDAVARKILADAGEKLGKYAVSLLSRLGEKDRKVGMYGSVLVKNAAVRETFVKTVKKSFPEAEISVPEIPPEIGAVYFAADRLGLDLKIKF